MKFRPIDEMSLRHLFSTAYAQEVLRLSYIGPVVNSSDVIETSPDCMILDMRSHPFRSLRCEFKFIPSSKSDFAHNGKFDVAIAWSLGNGLSKDQLQAELLEQNGCFELIVLDQHKAFQDLPAYTKDSLSRIGSVHIVRNLAIKREFPSVFALCMAAKLYPDRFHMDRMVKFLSTRFPSVAKMQPRGRFNVVSAFLQTKPPLLEFMHGKIYRWTSEFDSKAAVDELVELIAVNFAKQGPSKEDLEYVTE